MEDRLTILFGDLQYLGISEIRTQVMLALPLYILFELSLIVARISFRKARSAT